MAQDATLLTIAVIGGTGKEGSGLALRWAYSGYKVIIGSRSAERAADAAAQMNERLDGDYVVGLQNADAAAAANVVVLSVPYDGQPEIVEDIRPHLAGKTLVDVTVPVNPQNPREVFVPDGISAALETQDMVGPDVTVVSAFHNVSATHLKELDGVVDCDVLVFGDDAEAKAEVIQLIEAAGMHGVDSGPLANSVAAEALTPVLLYINKQYGVKGAGIRITGLA